MADQTPVETATPSAPEVDDAPPKKYESMEQIFEEILERSGLESFKDVPRSSRAVWVDPAGAAMVFKIGEPSPFGDEKNPADTVLGIFHDEDEIRVYTFPVKQGELKRYCLSKRGCVFVLDTFPDVDMWVDEMATEYASLIDDDDEETPPTNGATTTS